MAGKDKIRNVGPKSAAWLRQIGIRSIDDLRKVGSVEAYRRVKVAGFKPTLNLLYSMAGAEDDVHWTQLSEERKSALVLAAGEIDQVLLAKKKAFRTGGAGGIGEVLVSRALESREPVDHEAPSVSAGDDEG